MAIQENLTSRERVRLALVHQETDRIPKFDSFWADTIKRWMAQGAPIRELEDIWNTFDFDLVSKAVTRRPTAFPAVREVVRDEGDTVTTRNGDGAILRAWKNRSGTPEHIGFTVRDPDSWQPYRAALLETPPAARVDLDLNRQYEARAQRQMRWHCCSMLECFELAKNVIGHETLCIAMIENPEWVQDIFTVETEMIIGCLEYLKAHGIRWDGAWIYGDIAFNLGPFMSPRHYRELLQPAHRRLVGWFKDRGMPVIYHTDGRFAPLIPDLLATGVDCFQPLETKAGMDVCALKEQYGTQVAFMGNIDVMTLITNDRARIEAEVAAKLPVAKRGGGYLYHSDHSIPPQVTWETYGFLMQLVSQYGRYANA